MYSMSCVYVQTSIPSLTPWLSGNLCVSFTKIPKILLCKYISSMLTYTTPFVSIMLSLAMQTSSFAFMTSNILHIMTCWCFFCETLFLSNIYLIFSIQSIYNHFHFIQRNITFIETVEIFHTQYIRIARVTRVSIE